MLADELGAGVTYRSGSPFDARISDGGAVFSATTVPVASGWSTMVSGTGLLASRDCGSSWPRNQKMDMAATPAAMLAPATGRANRAQRAEADTFTASAG